MAKGLLRTFIRSIIFSFLSTNPRTPTTPHHSAYFVVRYASAQPIPHSTFDIILVVPFLFHKGIKLVKNGERRVREPKKCVILQSETQRPRPRPRMPASAASLTARVARPQLVGSPPCGRPAYVCPRNMMRLKTQENIYLYQWQPKMQILRHAPCTMTMTAYPNPCASPRATVLPPT